MVIKKYGNRRLYDTEESRYITLDDLAQKIRGGAEARVVDAKTEADLTQTTLVQIIMESRGAGKLLPIPLLTQLIRLSDDKLGEFFGQYVSSALELYLQAKQGMQNLFPYNPLALLPFSAQRMTAPAPAAPPSDVEQLRRELDELKTQLKKPKRRR